MSPIERAARVLCLVEDLDPDSSLGGDGQNFLWMEYAEVKVKPVLRAIRKPSEEMLEAASTGESWRPVDIGGMFTAMIDAALEGK